MLFVGLTNNALLLSTRAWRVSPGERDSGNPEALVLGHKENMSACFVALVFRELLRERRAHV